MGLETLLGGLVIGFSIAAPVGPIGVLCIRRTLADGRVAGLAVGLGAAAADAVYGAIAGFGLTAVSTLLVRQQAALRPVGGLFLCYLGIRTFLARPADRAAPEGGTGLLGAFAVSFGLTLANPATILSFVAVFAGLGIAGAGTWRDATILVVGVFLGSVLWWLMLSGAISSLRARLDPRLLRWVSRLSGPGPSGLRRDRARLAMNTGTAGGRTGAVDRAMLGSLR